MPALSDESKTILRWLRRTHRLPYPVRVYRVTRAYMATEGIVNGLFDPDRHPKHWVIQLHASLPAVESRETLLHEWAHGLCFIDQLAAHSQGDHDSIFTRTYNNLVEEFKLAFPNLPLRVDRLR